MIDQVIQFLKSAQYIMALTGAGISTESGIPDYRSKGIGLWEKVDPAEMASISYMLSNPKEFFEFNIRQWSKYMDVEPNITHRVLAAMEKAGYLHGVITQNIDNLHYKAGSKNLFEVHGHLRTAHCINCAEKYNFKELVMQFSEGINPPRCTCGCLIRPDVVLFGDPMCSDFYRALEQVKKCDLLIVVGSSLQVYPVAELPLYCEKFVIINQEPTPLDDRAEVVIHNTAGKVFDSIAHKLNVYY
ncbi:MAG: SIR2 family NAD-dependent protein deacylase [Tepidanaerobacteraceae bacterium]